VACTRVSECCKICVREKSSVWTFVLWRMFSCRHSCSCFCKHWRSTLLFSYFKGWLYICHRFTDGTTLYRIIWKEKILVPAKWLLCFFVTIELVLRSNFFVRNVRSRNLCKRLCVGRKFFIKCLFNTNIASLLSVVWRTSLLYDIQHSHRPLLKKLDFFRGGESLRAQGQ